MSAAALGTLDFSLLYDQENNALHCTITKAKVGHRRAQGEEAVLSSVTPKTLLPPLQGGFSGEDRIEKLERMRGGGWKGSI